MRTEAKKTGCLQMNRLHPSRRQVLVGLGGNTVLGLGLPRTAQAQTNEITIFTRETRHDDPWIEEYTAATGVKVNVIRTGSVDEMYAQTRSGAIEADILYVDTGSVPRYIKADLIAPLDQSKMPNASMISPSMDWVNRLPWTASFGAFPITEARSPSCLTRTP